MIREWIRRIREYPELELEKGLLEIDNYNLREAQEYLKWKLPKPVVITYSAPTNKRLTSYVKYRHILAVTAIANDIINDIVDTSDVDNCVLACAKWLDEEFDKGFFVYQSEKGERWRTPEETMQLRYGDCDDFMILLFYVIRKVLKLCGHWEEYGERLFCFDGTNNTVSYPDPIGRHAYLAWRSPIDNEFYTIESTGYRKHAMDNFLVLPQKRNKMYGTLRWIWNEKEMFNVNSLWYN